MRKILLVILLCFITACFKAKNIDVIWEEPYKGKEEKVREFRRLTDKEQERVRVIWESPCKNYSDEDKEFCDLFEDRAGYYGKALNWEKRQITLRQALEEIAEAEKNTFESDLPLDQEIQIHFEKVPADYAWELLLKEYELHAMRISSPKNSSPDVIEHFRISSWKECQQEEEAIIMSYENSNTCSKDSDCKLEFLSCPFGCVLTMNKDLSREIVKRVEKYQRNCRHCVYRCAPPKGEPRCVDSKCVLK